MNSKHVRKKQGSKKTERQGKNSKAMQSKDIEQGKKQAVFKKSS